MCSPEQTRPTARAPEIAINFDYYGKDSRLLATDLRRVAEWLEQTADQDCDLKLLGPQGESIIGFYRNVW